MLRRVVAAACATLAVVVDPRAADAAPVVQIEWPAIPGCPTESAVLERARAAIVHAKQVNDVLAVAEVAPPEEAGGAWRLHLRTRTVHGPGERTLEAPTCDALARAAGLFVAVAALRARAAPSAEHPIEELVPGPSFVEEPGVAAPALPLESAPARAAPSTETSSYLSASVGLRVANGVLPQTGAGPTASLGYEARKWRARIEVGAVLPQVAARRGSGAELRTFGASVDVCHDLPEPPLVGAVPRACVGATIDDVHARGVGGLETFDVRRAAAMAFFGLGATWGLGRHVRIGADARLGASVMRPTFVLDSPTGPVHLHRSAPVRAEATVTLGIAF